MFIYKWLPAVAQSFRTSPSSVYDAGLFVLISICFLCAIGRPTLSQSAADEILERVVLEYALLEKMPKCCMHFYTHVCTHQYG